MSLRKSMGDPPVGFAVLMQLETVSTTTFRSLTCAFQPGGHHRPANSNRAYGGHVYAQAVLAAAKTVPSGFIVHSVTGYFVKQGITTLPFVYCVGTIRTGRSYAVRTVSVTQASSADACFTCIASFKRPQHKAEALSYGAELPAYYAEALKGMRPEQQPDYLSTDETFFEELSVEEQNDPAVAFPGLVSKKVDMRDYNRRRPTHERRQLSYYQSRDILPSFASQPNLHACALLYASDRASLLSSGQMLGFRSFESMASLSHTVVFHATDESLSLTDAASGRRKWLFQEAWTECTADERIDHHSRLWNESGKHIATTFQDGMVKGASRSGNAKSNL